MENVERFDASRSRSRSVFFLSSVAGKARTGKGLHRSGLSMSKPFRKRLDGTGSGADDRDTMNTRPRFNVSGGAIPFASVPVLVVVSREAPAVTRNG